MTITWQAILVYTIAMIPVAMVSIFGFIKLFGESWIKKQMYSELETHKNKLLRETEKLKIELNKDFDKSVRYNQTEMQLIQELWLSLVEAVANTTLVSSRGKTYPDLSKMPDIEKEYVIDQLQIPDKYKCNLKASHDQVQLNKFYDRNNLYKAHESIGVAIKLYYKFGIVSDSNIDNKIEKLIQLMSLSLAEENIRIQIGDGAARDNSDNFIKHHSGLLDDIKNEIRLRMRNPAYFTAPQG